MGQCMGRCKCCKGTHSIQEFTDGGVFDRRNSAVPTTNSTMPAAAQFSVCTLSGGVTPSSRPRLSFNIDQALLPSSSHQDQELRVRSRKRFSFAFGRRMRSSPDIIKDMTRRLSARMKLKESKLNFENLSALADHLVLQILDIIVVLAASGEQEPPEQMVKLHVVAKCSGGWLAVVEALIKLVPESHPLGPAVTSMFIDECPLTTTSTVLEMLSHLNLSAALVNDPTKTLLWHRNVCIVLGCLAEKLAGQNCATIFQPQTLEYLLAHLEKTPNPNNSLHALIALEKYARTGVNKTKILEKIATLEENPLLRLEKLVNIRNPAEHELGFCAQWLLDNMLVSPGRLYTYEAIDTSDINVMLNHNDVSESLKISPDGLEARCDTASFESVRSTFHVTHGVWYYEATIITSGIMQIGWATKESSFGNHDGSGIGDDEYSVSYDGCRQKLWHNAKNMSCNYRPWRSGDIFGTLLDLDEQKVSFFINGDLVAGPHTDVFKSARNSSGFFAAASFMAFQHCRFNFGGRKTPFAYPPPVSYSSFNDFGKLNDDERRILPKPKMFELIQADLSDDACFVCCSEPGLVKLLPCGHSGYCGKCAQILQFCPQCRSQISSRLEV